MVVYENMLSGKTAVWLKRKKWKDKQGKGLLQVLMSHFPSKVDKVVVIFLVILGVDLSQEVSI